MSAFSESFLYSLTSKNLANHKCDSEKNFSGAPNPVQVKNPDLIRNSSKPYWHLTKFTVCLSNCGLILLQFNSQAGVQKSNPQAGGSTFLATSGKRPQRFSK